ncbi:hypothetical protein [Pseudonocardia oroxyli]|uniref:DUF3558 domain-containing protein n=1 Tax=Pseudonocardia oroxyli TaxID=366584 RepID=A0A1G7YSF7_PSEOR|nr:hypothetical protein [Pseudonocardia oroxyli]SDG99391.1 hypothetical protein SAMN05216377_117138 [Pseudonocardia oroxyli]
MRAVLAPVVLLLVAGCAVSVPGRAVPEPAPAAPTTAVLVSDVLPDECLLDAEGFALLLEAPVAPPANGGDPPSCATATTRGTPRGLAAINVYGVRGGTPADLLRSGRPLEVGDAAVVVDTAGGPTLQVATGDRLVTIAVADREPDDARWVEAGRRAVAALG